MDNNIVAPGGQGFFKSTVPEILGGAWYTELKGDVRGNGAVEVIQNKWIIEIPELAAYQGQDSRKLKAFISSATDRFRPSYGMKAADHKRGCVFFGTTNDEEFLEDSTGNRRYWVIKVSAPVNREWFRQNRDQLFAEACAAFWAAPRDKTGKPTDDSYCWWLTPQESRQQEEQTEQYSVTDALAERILSAAAGYSQPFSTFDIYKELVQGKPLPAMANAPEAFDATKLSQDMQRRIAGVLRTSRHYAYKNVRDGEQVNKRWCRLATSEVSRVKPISPRAKQLLEHLIDLYEKTGLSPVQNELSGSMNVTRQAISQWVVQLGEAGYIPERPTDAPPNTPRNLIPTREGYKLVGKFPARLLGVKK